MSGLLAHELSAMFPPLRDGTRAGEAPSPAGNIPVPEGRSYASPRGIGARQKQAGPCDPDIRTDHPGDFRKTPRSCKGTGKSVSGTIASRWLTRLNGECPGSRKFARDRVGTCPPIPRLSPAYSSEGGRAGSRRHLESRILGWKQTNRNLMGLLIQRSGYELREDDRMIVRPSWTSQEVKRIMRILRRGSVCA